MVEITLKNGSKFQIHTLVFHGKPIDSNGTEAGGNTTYPFTESDVNALNSVVPLQAAYNAVFVPVPEEVDSAEE